MLSPACHIFKLITIVTHCVDFCIANFIYYICWANIQTFGILQYGILAIIMEMVSFVGQAFGDHMR